MGISRDSRHKHRLTGGRMPIHKKKRLYEMGRSAANTRLGDKRVRRLRVRGGNFKFRALRLEAGNFVWQSEAVTRKTRILDVVYNATNNELVRTKTLVKNTIVQIDGAPFRKWYQTHYHIELGRKGKKEEEAKKETKTSKRPKKLARVVAARVKSRYLDANVEEQFNAGRLLACISSRPGQSGRADGYILEGRELEFYAKKIVKK